MTQKPMTTRPKSEPEPASKVVGTMTAAASITGISKPAIQLAKRMGSTAFRLGSRIEIYELKAFCETKAFRDKWEALEAERADVEQWEIRFKRAQALRAELKLQALRAGAWNSDQAKLLFAAGDAALADVLRKKLLKIQPGRIAGKSAPEILKVNRAFLDALLVDLTAARVAAVEKVAATLPADDDDD